MCEYRFFRFLVFKFMPQAKETSCLVMRQQIKQAVSGFGLLFNLFAALRRIAKMNIARLDLDKIMYEKHLNHAAKV